MFLSKCRDHIKQLIITPNIPLNLPQIWLLELDILQLIKQLPN